MVIYDVFQNNKPFDIVVTGEYCVCPKNTNHEHSRSLTKLDGSSHFAQVRSSDVTSSLCGT